MNSNRQLPVKLVLAAGSALVALSLGLGALWLVLPQQRFQRIVAMLVPWYDPRPEPVVPTTVGRFDPQLGWALEPNAVGTSRRTGEVVTYKINSHGIRDKEIPYAKPPGEYRIVMLGDSRTFGFGNNVSDHFTSLLEGYLKNVEVVNMGVSGYGIDQSLLFFRSEGHPSQGHRFVMVPSRSTRAVATWRRTAAPEA